MVLPNMRKDLSVSDMHDHYGALATTYDELWLYSDNFVAALVAKIAAALKLKASDRFVDIGCGTGLYARALRDSVGIKPTITCVDPSAAMLDHMSDNNGLERVVVDAIPLLEGGVEGDKFLMKEVNHHIDDITTVFNGFLVHL